MKATLQVGAQPYEVSLQRTPKGWQVDVDGETFDVSLQPNGAGVLARVGDRSIHVELHGEAARIDGVMLPVRVLGVTGIGRSGAAQGDALLHVRPPMNGKLERVVVSPGQEVQRGDVLFVLEAMKMQNEVKSPAAGRIKAIHLAAGATVEPKQVVLDLEPI